MVHMLTSVSDNPHRKDHVYEGAIQDVLTYVRNATVDFRSGCLGVLFTLLAAHEQTFDSSLATIMSALVCGYLDSCPISPENILRGLMTLLPSHGGNYSFPALSSRGTEQSISSCNPRCVFTGYVKSSGELSNYSRRGGKCCKEGTRNRRKVYQTSRSLRANYPLIYRRS